MSDYKHLSSWQSVLLSMCFIVLIGSVQYSEVTSFGYLNLDDTNYIVDDPVTAAGLTGDSLNHAFTTFHNPYFMPVTRLSFMLDVSGWGVDNPGGFHITNVFLHISNTLLIFVLVFSAIKRSIPALVVALIFLVHPQHVEAVAWIASRKEVLASFFGLASLFTYQLYTTHNTIQRKAAFYLLSWVLLLLSLMAKPIWLMLPFLMLVWDCYFLERMRIRDKAYLLEKIPFFLLVFTYAVFFKANIPVDIIVTGYKPDYSLVEMLIMPFVAVGHYISNTFYPVGLQPYYPHTPSVHWLMGLAGLFGMVICILAVFKCSNRFLKLGLLWFIISLVPMMQFAVNPPGVPILVANRFSYLPHVGLFIGLVLGIEFFLRAQTKKTGVVVYFILALILVGLFGITKKQIRVWESPEVLWSYSLDNLDGVNRSYPISLLALHYYKSNDMNGVIKSYTMAFEVDKTNPKYPLTLAQIYLQNPDYKNREKYLHWLKKFKKYGDATTEVLLTRGSMSLGNRDFHLAEAIFEKALNNPLSEPERDKKVRALLGVSRLFQSDFRGALAAFKLVGMSLGERKMYCSLVLNVEKSGLVNEYNRIDFVDLLDFVCKE